MAMTEQIPPEPRRPRQFTLAGLMSFVAGWSAYCSVIAAARSWGGSNYSGDERYRRPNSWLMGVTVATCWAVLWFLYRRWGLRHALKVHYAGPIIFMSLSVLLGFVVLGAALGHSGAADLSILLVFLVPLLAALYGCFISILIGFPIAVIMLFYVRPSGQSAKEASRVTGPERGPAGR
jgi:hypothetical protein